MPLEDGVGANWFTNRVRRKLNNGRTTSFWKDRWIRVEPLCIMFPRLFSLSTQKEAMVGDVVVIQQGVSVWNITWRRVPFI